MSFVGNLLGFPAVKKLWKSVKNWQTYRHSVLFICDTMFSNSSDLEIWITRRHWKRHRSIDRIRVPISVPLPV